MNRGITLYVAAYNAVRYRYVVEFIDFKSRKEADSYLALHRDTCSLTMQEARARVSELNSRLAAERERENALPKAADTSSTVADAQAHNLGVAAHLDEEYPD